MKLWELRPIDFPNDYSGPKDPWNPWYDKAFGMIVRAETEAQAREIASENCWDEGAKAWLNTTFSTCSELLQDGPVEVIMLDGHSA